jgi:LPXTG-motif cell wall-anchored protein
LTDEVQTLSGFFTATVKETAKALVEVEAGYKYTGLVNGFTYDGYSFTSNTVTKGANTLTLTKTGDVVTGWSVKAGTVTATIVSPTMFVVTADTAVAPATPIPAGTVLTTGAAFEAVNTVYKAFAALLGFNVTTTGINFTDENIIANYAAGGKTAAVGTYLPYTSSLTVTDGTAVPNTGDNMSVIGFVMVGLALLATAAVIVKKVRA